MKYQVWLIDKRILEEYLDENNTSKQHISLEFVKREGKKLFETEYKEEFEDKMDFFWSRYTTNVSVVLAFEEGNYYEW